MARSPTVDPTAQLSAVRVLKEGNALRMEAAAERMRLAQQEMEEAEQEAKFLEAAELRWQLALLMEPSSTVRTPGEIEPGAAKPESISHEVDEVLIRVGRPMRIKEIFDDLKGSGRPANYFSIRTVLQRGTERGYYKRDGHLYSLHDTQGEDAPTRVQEDLFAEDGDEGLSAEEWDWIPVSGKEEEL